MAKLFFFTVVGFLLSLGGCANKTVKKTEFESPKIADRKTSGTSRMPASSKWNHSSSFGGPGAGALTPYRPYPGVDSRASDEADRRDRVEYRRLMREASALRNLRGRELIDRAQRLEDDINRRLDRLPGGRYGSPYYIPHTREWERVIDLAVAARQRGYRHIQEAREGGKKYYANSKW